MTKQKQTLDMTQLFGFSDVTNKVDINTPELAARVGAKVGIEDNVKPTESPAKPFDTAQLFGFETIATEVDFRDASVASQVGAKIGDSERT